MRLVLGAWSRRGNTTVVLANRITVGVVGHYVPAYASLPLMQHLDAAGVIANNAIAVHVIVGAIHRPIATQSDARTAVAKYVIVAEDVTVAARIKASRFWIALPGTHIVLDDVAR